jgi:hypothetical protein
MILSNTSCGTSNSSYEFSEVSPTVTEEKGVPVVRASNDNQLLEISFPGAVILEKTQFKALTDKGSTGVTIKVPYTSQQITASFSDPDEYDSKLHIGVKPSTKTLDLSPYTPSGTTLKNESFDVLTSTLK